MIIFSFQVFVFFSKGCTAAFENILTDLIIFEHCFPVMVQEYTIF